MDRGSIGDWMWRFLVLLLACVLAAVLPQAIGRAAAAATEEQGPVDVELSPILAPMVVENRLAGYAYITVALAPSGRDKVAVIREKMAFLQDAFLREVNKASILKADDAKAIDTQAITARLTARMDQILPRGTVGELKLQQIVIALFNS